MPAAYYENLDERPGRKVEQWPETLNLQGVDGFDPSDAIYYLIESGVGPKTKQTRWVNDSSLNLQFHSAEDAAVALHQLTDPEAGDPSTIPAEVSRKAKSYKGLHLTIRQANTGDQKQRGAATYSKYYENNPDARGADRRPARGREQEQRRRQPPRRDFLDYGEDEPSRNNRRRYSGSGDEQMRDSSEYDQRRNRRNGNRMRDDGRLNAPDVDSYRPGSQGYVSRCHFSCGRPLTFPVHESHDSDAYEAAVLRQSQAARAMDVMVLRKQAHRRAANTEVEAAVATTVDGRNPALRGGLTIEPTTIASRAHRHVGRRTLPRYVADDVHLLCKEPWLIDMPSRGMAMSCRVRASTADPMLSTRVLTEAEDLFCHA